MTYSLNHSITLEKIEKEMIDDRPTGMNQSIKNLPKGKERKGTRRHQASRSRLTADFIVIKVSIQGTVQVHHVHVQVTITLILDQCQEQRKASNPKMELWTGYHIRTLQPSQIPHRHCTPRIHARMDGTHEHTRRNPSQEQCQQCSVVGEGQF